MNDSYLRIKERAEEEIVIEKSRFIAYAAKTETEEQARDFISEIKKLHPFATHNCFAFVAENGAVKRFSDDGEPQGTAGQPMLEVLESKGLSDTCVVVTRYFGGIKLGAGGLVRAYSGATAKVLCAAGAEEVVLSTVFSLVLSYDAYPAFVKFSSGQKCAIEKTDFSDSVNVTLSVPKKTAEDFKSKFIDLTLGKAAINAVGDKFSVYGVEK